MVRPSATLTGSGAYLGLGSTVGGLVGEAMIGEGRTLARWQRNCALGGGSVTAVGSVL